MIPDDSTPYVITDGYEVPGAGEGCIRWCSATISDVHFSEKQLPTARYARPARFGATFGTSSWSIGESISDERREPSGYLTWFALFEPGDVSVLVPDLDDGYSVEITAAPKTLERASHDWRLFAPGGADVAITRWGGGVPTKSLDRVQLGATATIDHAVATPFVLIGLEVQYLLREPEILEQATELD
jgi:hypothetical protein